MRESEVVGFIRLYYNSFVIPPRYPSLYQINARTWVNQFSSKTGEANTLDDVPDEALAEIANLGFDWIYLLGVWQTGEIGERIARQSSNLLQENMEDAGHHRTQRTLTEEDVCGSCFAIIGYTVNKRLGGNAALERLRQRLDRQGLRLMLDFIPNHTAIDHPWTQTHPEFYLERSKEIGRRYPECCFRLATNQGERLVAHGRDPYFPPWTDTLQLDYTNPELVIAMQGELQHAASLCDGLRCDMAMLILPEIFKRTWGSPALPFWQEAIEKVHQSKPDFTFMAEVYWDLEWTLQQLGFDYTYDKRLYDRLLDLHAHPVREHLRAGLAFQNHLARFLENHDEMRAATAFPPDIHRAAAVITFLAPGLRFFQQGQLEGYQKRVPMQLCWAPTEPGNPALKDFYARLMGCLRLPILRSGEWQMIEPLPAWDGNWTWQGFIAYAWHGPTGENLVAAVNYSPHQSQCYLRLPFDDLRERYWRLRDLLEASDEQSPESARFEKAGNEMVERGLLLDLPEWGVHVYSFEEQSWGST
jgi:hypothetical protein